MNIIMKQIGIILGLVIFISTQALYGQSTIMRDGQVIILQEGERTNMAIDQRYIYRNDVDTAYALIVGHFYTTEEVKRAFGEPQKIKDNISYENGFAFDGNISYTYDSLFLSLDFYSGLGEIQIEKKNVSLCFDGIPLTIGGSYRPLDEKYPNPAVRREPGSRTIDEKTGMTEMGLMLNFSGDDDWLILGLLMQMTPEIDLLINNIQYLPNN